jgi:hypothetical protein
LDAADDVLFTAYLCAAEVNVGCVRPDLDARSFASAELPLDPLLSPPLEPPIFAEARLVPEPCLAFLIFSSALAISHLV